MKQLVFAASILLSSFILASGQSQNNQVLVSGSGNQQESLGVPRQTSTGAANSGGNADRTSNSRLGPSRQMIFRENVEPLYRKLTDEERKMMLPNAEDIKKFDEFLEQSETGLVKLVPDLGCADNTKIVVATEECLKYKMPGAGSSYSFRTESYRIRRLADLTFTDGKFHSSGALVHGILVNLGDVPLETVSAATKGVKFLNDFVPVGDREEGAKTDKVLLAGVTQDGFIYRKFAKAEENSTYVLRSVAYRGAFYRSVMGVTYNEFDYDKRQDVLIAFRVVRKDADGSVTILWKAIWERSAPKLRDKKAVKPSQYAIR